MLMPYSECRSDLGFASPPVLPPYVFRNRIGCFRLQLSAGRLPLPAADICTQAGCDMVIANGSSPSVLYDIADGKPVGSRFRGKKG